MLTGLMLHHKDSRPFGLVYSACDLANHDGYTGHLRFLVELIERAGCDVAVVGYANGVSVVPHATGLLNGRGYATLLRSAIIFIIEVVRNRPDFIVFTS